jgi:hypothetical protein
MMSMEDLIRSGVFSKARIDWEEYGDTKKMLAFIQEYGVSTGYEAAKLAELLQPIKVTGKKRTTQKTRLIIRAYKFMRIRHDAEKNFFPKDYPSMEQEVESLARSAGIEPESLKKLIQREGLHKKRTV